MKLSTEIEKRLAAFIHWGLILVTILVADRISTDPVNVGKMVGLTILTSCSVALIIGNFRILVREYPLLYLVNALFVLICTLSIIFSKNPWESGFYGEYGRNTGLLTYIGLVGLFVAVSALRRSESHLRILKALMIAGYLNIIYAIYYLTGRDFFSWVNPYKKFIGTFGNPNFISSFMGIFATVVFSFILAKFTSGKIKAFLILSIFVSLYVIKLTGSLQGFIVVMLGVSMVLGLYLYLEIKNRGIFYSYITLQALVALLGFLGTLQKGPLTSLVYKNSVSLRGEYWQAGINMGIDNPFLGVGLDSYGTFYREYRDLSALTNPGVNTVTNAAHNVFIDIFAGTGFIGLFCYIALKIMVFWIGIKLIKKVNRFDPVLIALFSAWMAYEVQSFISINQIGLAIWGWALCGAVASYARVQLTDSPGDRSQNQSLKFRGSSDKNRNLQPTIIPAIKVVSILLALILSIAISIPPLVNDYRQLKALQKKDLKSLTSTAWTWPVDNSRLRSVGGVLLRSGDQQSFIDFNLRASKKFPSNYYFQYYLFSASRVDSPQWVSYKRILHEMDPYNPEFAPK